jgi:hypothetical protein
VSGFRCQRRPDETIGDAATRCATDAVYHERDRGGDMHTAGELAADAVLGLVVEWLAKDVNPRVAFRLLRALGRTTPRASRSPRSLHEPRRAAGFPRSSVRALDYRAHHIRGVG